MFRVRSGGIVSDVDSAVCYLGVRERRGRFAHPATGEMATLISLNPRLWQSMAGDARIVGHRRIRMLASSWPIGD